MKIKFWNPKGREQQEPNDDQKPGKSTDSLTISCDLEPKDQIHEAIGLYETSFTNYRRYDLIAIECGRRVTKYWLRAQPNA